MSERPLAILPHELYGCIGTVGGRPVTNAIESRGAAVARAREIEEKERAAAPPPMVDGETA